jgi:hypothetical protein
MQGLDAGNLHRLARPRRKAGLDDPGIDSDRVELRGGLADNLAAMRDDQDMTPGLGRLGNDRRGDDRLARSGRRDQ